VCLSTDNQTDQLEQLYSRVSIKLSEESGSCVMKVSDNNFGSKLVENITSKNHKFVIFCLNNSSQIEKLTKELWCTLGDTREYQQYTMKVIKH
jgi:ribosome-interacting GTPase 1